MSQQTPVYLTAQFFKNALEHGMRTAGIEIVEQSIENITLGGENYCSDIYRATLKYRHTTEQSLEKLTSLIIKSMPASKQGILHRLQIYCKETLFYLDIKPKIEALMWLTQQPWSLATNHIYCVTHPEETIVFEDLCMQGFQQQSRQLGLDREHAILVIQKLAQYHALTMIMAEKEPEIVITRYPFGLLNIDSIKGDTFKALFGAQLLKLTALIADCPEFKGIAQKLQNYHDNFTERVLKAVYPLRGEINVLNHGDLWVNNLFFKYDDNKTVKEVRFIDFQMCFYGSLGFDINYFLNSSIQLDVLRHHRHQLIETYFQSLISTLESVHYRKPLPSYEDILYEIQQREAYGFFVAYGFFPLMSMVSLDSQDNSLENFCDQEFARRKIELMFKSNKRTMETLKYDLLRLNDLGILD